MIEQTTDIPVPNVLTGGQARAPMVLMPLRTVLIRADHRILDAVTAVPPEFLVPPVKLDKEITLVEPDPSWPDWYAREEHRIRTALGTRAPRTAICTCARNPNWPPSAGLRPILCRRQVVCLLRRSSVGRESLTCGADQSLTSYAVGECRALSDKNVDHLPLIRTLPALS